MLALTSALVVVKAAMSTEVEELAFKSRFVALPAISCFDELVEFTVRFFALTSAVNLLEELVESEISSAINFFSVILADEETLTEILFALMVSLVKIEPLDEAEKLVGILLEYTVTRLFLAFLICEFRLYCTCNMPFLTFVSISDRCSALSASTTTSLRLD